jgi:hypothetical protein
MIKINANKTHLPAYALPSPSLTHSPQMGIKIITQFIIAHLRLAFLGHPLPCLPHLLLDLLLTLVVTVVAAIVAIQPTVMIAASVVVPPSATLFL